MALGVLAGCSSSPGLSSRLTRVPSFQADADSLPAKSASPPASLVARSADPVPTGIPARGLAGHDEIVPAPPPAVHVPAVNPPLVNDWISLENWSETNHLEAPRRRLGATNL